MKETLEVLRDRLTEAVEAIDAMEEGLVPVTVKLAVPGDVKRAYVAGLKVPFNGDTGRVWVAPGTHRLIWDVYGLPGTKYQLGISEPAPAAFEREFDIDGDGSDGGTWKFTV